MNLNHKPEILAPAGTLHTMFAVGRDSRLIMSKKRAQYERAWGRIQRITDSGETVRGTVIEVVKGGLIVDCGIRGFVPISQIDQFLQCGDSHDRAGRSAGGRRFPCADISSSRRDS